MLTVTMILALVALALSVTAALERTPLWCAVFVLSVLALLTALPLGR